jgi:predicted nucleic acid-binding protein
MIVVADTSPLNYLIQIKSDGLLQTLYQQVLVPPAVMQELNHPAAPAAVHVWLRNLPSWITIIPVHAESDPTLQSLDPGEREAIQLAQQQHADILLIDERKGRQEAHLRGLLTTGTLGVLIAATDLGLIEPEATYDRLISTTTFRSTAQLRASFLDAVRRRNT